MTISKGGGIASAAIHLQTTGFERLLQPTFAENAMFEAFECQCIHVEMSNDSYPHSGRVEYRAKSCPVCQARAALLRVHSRTIIAFHSSAPRYQRTH